MREREKDVRERKKDGIERETESRQLKGLRRSVFNFSTEKLFLELKN